MGNTILVMRTIVLFFIVLLNIVALGCITDSNDDIKYTDVSVAQAKAMIDGGEYFLLDVRTQEEYDAGHIDSPVLIPYDELENRLDEVPADMPVLIYCRTARRSAIAAQVLVDNGYTEVYNMAGGIVAWENAGYPVES
ncbi:MAG: rhodanese-like domain-containing protein [ANME-2 cluster archaeon]|nr:rhodanese-like domain-containing protein [ANME-2 cluster archaeon]